MTLRKQRSLSEIPLSELRRKIRLLRKADFRSLSAAVVDFRIRSIIDQYMFQVRPLELSAVYRARRNAPGESFSLASQLWYPPAAFVTRPSRLNEPGQVLFYGSSMPNTAIFELRPGKDEVFTVLIAGMKSGQVEKLNVAFIGLERAQAPEVQHLTDADLFRRAPGFRTKLGPANYKKWLLVDDYLSEIFGTPVTDGEEHKYKPTIALSKLLFTAPNLDAINYPSVATGDHGINICMLPDKADKLFTSSEAWELRVGERSLHPGTGELLHRVTFLRRSRQIHSDGAIEWYRAGEGIKPEEIMRFVRRRMEGLQQWPVAAE